ncbi:hypothetical protein [Glutamicibacter halophytocola]|uniref:Uncharacterized protein n=2 Tax=Glutamicibacter TaxID=1742989 RepID=A0AA94XRC3_9MICC|nr:hypothetical protein [Glutamicibacter halophytocola]UUX58470.1 hypothetical protein NUH22_14385 [Glutamicibacter halophytocola]
MSSFYRHRRAQTPDFPGSFATHGYDPEDLALIEPRVPGETGEEPLALESRESVVDSELDPEPAFESVSVSGVCVVSWLCVVELFALLLSVVDTVVGDCVDASSCVVVRTAPMPITATLEAATAAAIRLDARRCWLRGFMVAFSHFDGYLQFDSPKAFFDHALPFVATVFEYLRDWHGLGSPSRALVHIDLRNLHSANR